MLPMCLGTSFLERWVLFSSSFWYLVSLCPIDLIRLLVIGYFRSVVLTLFYRYWAVLGPQFLLVAFIFSIIIYGALNLMDTAPLDSYNLITGT